MIFRNHRTWIGLQPIDALFDDAVGLLHLFHAHQITVIHVTGLAHWDIKVQQIIDIVRLLLAQIPSYARATQHGARKAHIQSTLGRDNTDIDSTLFPDAVVGQQGVILLQALGEALCEVINKVQQGTLSILIQFSNTFGIAHLARFELRHRVRQIAVHPTGTEIGSVHPGTAGCFVHVEKVFALAKRVNQNGRTTAIIAVGAQPHQVIQQTGDFGKHHTDVLRTHRHINTQ